MQHQTVQISKKYLTLQLILIILLAIHTLGLSLIAGFIYRKQVLKRHKIYLQSKKTLHIDIGRLFVLDNIDIPIKSIDNIKIDNSVMGRIFGWCTIIVQTTSSGHKLSHVDYKQAQEMKNIITKLR